MVGVNKSDKIRENYENFHTRSQKLETTHIFQGIWKASIRPIFSPSSNIVELPQKHGNVAC